MHLADPTYRPPYEIDSVLLQVTIGCSHNACTFCSMYHGVDFSISPLEEVEADLAEYARLRPYADRVFLTSGDAFTLPAERLLAIGALIKRYLPDVESIGGYASIKNIRAKTDDELRALTQAGFGDFNVGLESGLDDVLRFMNKGCTAAEAREQLERLNAVGMPFNVNIINGAAGPKRIAEHAAANAAIVNAVKPTLVFVSPLHVDPGSALEGLVNAGLFEECTLGQYIEEEIAFLEGLDLDGCRFYGRHVSNPVPVSGMLQRDKERLLGQLRAGMMRFSDDALTSTPRKGNEGRLYL